MEQIVTPQSSGEIVALQGDASHAAAGPARGLTLVLGPPNAGKMGLLLEWWRERLDQRPVIVVPNLPTAHDLSAEMVARARVVLGAGSATTFDGLVRLVLGRPPRYLDNFEQAVLVARILRSRDFRFLTRGASYPALAARLAEFLDQLAESGHDWNEVKSFLDRWALESVRCRDLAADLAYLVEMFREACGALGVTSRLGAVLQAARSAEGWDRPVGFYGFTSLTPAQRKLVEALAQRAEVVLVMPHDKDKMIELSAKSEISFWQPRATRVVEVDRRDRAYSSPAIAYLERYFSGGVSPTASEPRPGTAAEATDAAEGVRFLLSAGRQAEAEAVAEQVAELLRRGFRPSDIAVVVRRIAEWARLIGQVFASCHIPYQIDQSVPLGQTAIGRAFLSALQAAVEKDPEALLGFLHSPYSGTSPELVDLLELNYRRAGARGFAVLLEEARRLNVEAVDHVLALASNTDQGASISFDWQAAIHLAATMLATAVASGEEGAQEQYESAAVFRVLIRAAEAMLAFSSLDECGLAPLSPQEMLALLRDISVGLVPSALQRDAVWVVSAERARARRFSAVVVLGLVEGEFPGARAEASLLTKAQQAEIEKFGGPIPVREESREDALFALAISRAWQVLILSGRDTDDNGDACEVSRFWSEAKNLLGVADEQVLRRGLGEQVFAPSRAPSLRHFLRGLAAQGSRENRQEEPSPGLRSPAVLEQLANKKDFTPSELENYLQCPFLWFGQQVLGLEEMQQEFDDRAVGEALHAVLSRVYRWMAERGMLPLTPQVLSQGEELVSAAVEEVVEQNAWSTALPSHRLGIARVAALARLELALEARLSRQFRLAATEHWIGAGRGVEVDGLRLRGRVDRIDVGPDGALFVVDYKSGGVPRDSALGSREGLQLPLYLAALVAERPTMPVAGGAYVSPREGRFVGVVRQEWKESLADPRMGLKVMEDAEWQALLRQTLDISREAAAGIRAGRISPLSDRQCPGWCSLGAVCRARRGVA